MYKGERERKKPLCLFLSVVPPLIKMIMMYLLLPLVSLLWGSLQLLTY